MSSIFSRRDRHDARAEQLAFGDPRALQATFRHWIRGRPRPEVIRIGANGLDDQRPAADPAAKDRRDVRGGADQ